MLGKGSGSKGSLEPVNELGNSRVNEEGFDSAVINDKGQHILASSATFDLFGGAAQSASSAGADKEGKKEKPAAAKKGKKREESGDGTLIRGDDEMDNPSLKKLLVAVAQLGLHTSLETKIVKSISVDVLRISRKLGLLDACKSRTKEYHTFLRDLPQNERESQMPPYTIVWCQMVETVLAAMATTATADDGVKVPMQVLSDYTTKVKALQGHHRYEFLVGQVNFCRVRQVFSKEHANIETSVTPDTEAAGIWHHIVQYLCQYTGARRLDGIAPKTNLERRIEQMLRRLGVWRTQPE